MRIKYLKLSNYPVWKPSSKH
uniref:Uncharacterized protein n=1 Tax=Arundo donax TaxID=35708 RepID=A0A0A9AF38_ARUDO